HQTDRDPRKGNWKSRIGGPIVDCLSSFTGGTNAMSNSFEQYLTALRRPTARSRSVLLVVACGTFLRALNVAELVATFVGWLLALPSKWLALPTEMPALWYRSSQKLSTDWHRFSLATWSRCARLRPLLSAAPESLSWFRQTQRWLLTCYLALPDRKYR